MTAHGLVEIDRSEIVVGGVLDPGDRLALDLAVVLVGQVEIDLRRIGHAKAALVRIVEGSHEPPAGKEPEVRRQIDFVAQLFQFFPKKLDLVQVAGRAEGPAIERSLGRLVLFAGGRLDQPGHRVAAELDARVVPTCRG